MNIYSKLLLLSTHFEKLAFKALDAVLKRVDMPIIMETKDDFSVLIPLKIDETSIYPTGMVALDSPNVQMNEGYNPSEFKRIAAIQGPDAWTSMYLFGVALYVGKKIVSDSSVTPAAQAVMKRIYEKNKDNPNMIIQDVLVEQPSTANMPWMRAAYLNPGNGDAQYQASLEAGRQIRNLLPKEHFEMLIDRVQYDWKQMYLNEKETGGHEGIVTQNINSGRKGKFL